MVPSGPADAGGASPLGCFDDAPDDAVWSVPEFSRLFSGRWVGCPGPGLPLFKPAVVPAPSSSSSSYTAAGPARAASPEQENLPN